MRIRSTPKNSGVLVKATFYLDPRDLSALEKERERRRAATGKRRGIDLSALVREAIRKTYR